MLDTGHVELGVRSTYTVGAESRKANVKRLEMVRMSLVMLTRGGILERSVYENDDGYELEYKYYTNISDEMVLIQRINDK